MLYNFLLLILSIITRFFGLGWGDGFYFHPDENNMAWAIERLAWPKLDPNFFAYGQFPLYLTYFSLPKPISFDQAVWGLRFWSALFSTVMIVIGYHLARLVFVSRFWARVYSLLLIFTPGLIQTAHFGTTESILTFVGVALTLLSLKYFKNGKRRVLILASLVSSIGLASKLNAGLFFLPLIIAIFSHKNKFRNFFLWASLSLVISFIFSPYYLLEFKEVLRIFKYESSIAGGFTPIFYTRQFINTSPFWFQLKRIFPWVLGLPMFCLLIISLSVFGLHVTGYLFEKEGLSSRPKWRDLFFKNRYITVCLLLAGFLPWFVFNSLLFVKWTRFMVPVLPFLVLFIVWGLKKLKIKSLKYLLIFLLVLPGVLYMKIYLQPDVRIQAMEWINNNLPQDSVILYEGGNVIDLPGLDRGKFETLSLDFYHLDENKQEQAKLEKYLKQADYYLMPSRRLFANHIRLPESYSYSASFYHKVFVSDKFELLKKFTPFGPLGQFMLGTDLVSEETWTVFDHPTIRLFEIN